MSVKKIEYELATITLNGSAEEKKLLNDLGNVGWELVTIVKNKNTGMVASVDTSALAYFKREK